MIRVQRSQARRRFSNVCVQRKIPSPYAMRIAGGKHVALAVALLCLMQTALAAPGCSGNSCTVQLEGLVTKGACEFDFTPNLPFDRVIPADFTENGGTAQIKTFTLTLHDCVGPEGGSAKAGVMFLGTTLTDPGQAPAGAIFSEDNTGVMGFMFRAGKFTKSLGDFRKNGTDLVVNGMPATWDDDRFDPGVVPVNGTPVEYTAGFVWNGKGTIPVNKTVTAVVTFGMNYR